MPAQAAPAAAAIRAMQHTLAQAADAQLAEVVSLVDAMSDRGAADGLLAPLRPRLQQLRPQRRMSLRRLLFVPLDPLIVPAAQWRRGSLAIPRSALPCIAAEIHEALGPLADELEADIAKGASDAQHTTLACGTRLWPIAADLLRRCDMSTDWTSATGMTASDHTAICFSISVLLSQGAAIEAIVQQSARGSEALAPMIRACIIAAVTSTGPDRLPPGDPALGIRSIAMLIATLLTRLANADHVLTIAGDVAVALANPAPRLASDLAVTFMLDSLQAGQSGATGLPSASDLSRMAGLLDALDQPGPANRPGFKTRVAKLRHDSDIACRKRFETGIETCLRGCADGLGENATDSSVQAMEAAIIELRRLEAAGRIFGGGALYERMLKQAAKALIDRAPPTAQVMDLARLVEILQGPEAALELLAKS